MLFEYPWLSIGFGDPGMRFLELVPHRQLHGLMAKVAWMGLPYFPQEQMRIEVLHLRELEILVESDGRYGTPCDLNTLVVRYHQTSSEARPAYGLREAHSSQTLFVQEELVTGENPKKHALPLDDSN
jgi:hypothetical protein